jgi:hypothetical protein
MPRAVELLRQGRNEELWQMCCGFLGLRIGEFMDIQKRLLLEQLELLNKSELGKKIMRGAEPRTVAEFRRRVPLTTYKDYCPELLEKKENILPAKPVFWVHTSGRSGEYPCKWVPITEAYAHEMSVLMYGIGMLSSCNGPDDTHKLPERPKLVYTVAPRPYMSGAMADILGLQTPLDYLPALEEAESLSFEDRVRLGFQQALTKGFDYFFGLSMVLVAVGEKFKESSTKINIRDMLFQPRVLLRLTKGLVKSQLARRPMLPKDLWAVRGIIGSGIDSWVYQDRIKELWGRYPLDVYASTEGGVFATQTWDYDSMTFIPNLNFLEFISEEEHFKWQMDRSYQPKTVLLDEVKAGENYEIVISSFHGGALVRYRVGDMVRITSLRNEALGIEIPQMAFERRVDGLLDFVVVRLTEKTIWQAIESTGIAYEDWTAYKEPGEPVLKLFVELKDGYRVSEADIASAVHEHIMKAESDDLNADSPLREDFADSIDFRIEVTLLPRGAFAGYTTQRQAEGADLAHLKPPHINPPDKVLSLLLPETEEIVVVTKRKTEAKTETAAATEDGTEADKVAL